MTYQLFTRPDPVEPARGPATPAVSVCRAGVHGPDDALVVNAPALALLTETLGQVVSVELLFDPDTDTVGVRPCRAVAGPEVFPVDATRFLGAGEASARWSTRMRAEWPVKVLAAPFIRHWRLIGQPLGNPYPAELDDARTMLTFPVKREAAPL